MPELPEVETVRRYLARQLPGQRLVEIELRRDSLRYPIPVEAVRALAGGTVVDVRRRAKYLLLDVIRPAGTDRAGTQVRVALVHLGMSGRLFVDDADAPDEWRKHEHWRWTLEGPAGRQRLRYVDARRFGALDVVTDEASHPLLSALGPEPFDPAFSGPQLLAWSRGLRTAVKAFLMDAHRVVGIGNIYASETCYRARVHPLRPAGSLRPDECDALVEAARAVLADAIAAGGTTLMDFVGGDESPGYFGQQLEVYERAGEPCLRCKPRRGRAPLVEKAVLANRATYFCPACQG